MAEPPATPVTPESPPVLNYLAPTRAQRHASGGLMLMGLAIGGLTIFALAPAVPDFFESGVGSLRPWELLALLIPLAIAAWGVFYVVSAVMIRRGNTRLAPAAMTLVVIQTLILLGFSVFGVIAVWADAAEYDQWLEGLMVTILLAAVNIGFGSVIFELRKVIREARFNTVKRMG